MDFGKLTLDEIKQGYRYDNDTEEYICNYCGKRFAKGQIFTVADYLYEAKTAAEKHITAEHGGNFHQLVHSDTKYNTLTDVQKELLELFRTPLSDKEIAEKAGVSASTIRHQKFTFREKAKQAKLYLAVYEWAFSDKTGDKEAMIPIHDHAAYYDDRYVITEQEREQILQTAFRSLDPPRLKQFSAKEKKKVVILTKISGQFERGRTYTEQEVNEILRPVYEDYTAIRRYLIMYGFMKRTKDGKGYWLT